MAYDRELAERIRAVLHDQPNLSEKAMFGGLGFMVNGNMGIAASGQGGLMVRVDPTRSEALLADGTANRMVMKGREMDGWLRVSAENCTDESTLERWVRLGIAYADSLPPK